MRGTMHHLDLTVRDVEGSAPFYDAVLGFLGYRRTRNASNGIDWDLATPKGVCSIGIKPARSLQEHDRYSCGLHHFALRADSRSDVDDMYRLLLNVGATILDAPMAYPRYGNGYYAVFFADPDGLKFEFVFYPGFAT